jgi:protein-tyrosine phosphatase
MIKVLFVCLGNICRSPMAEGLFKHLVETENLSTVIETDSAGTSAYHIGELADPRMRKTASNYSINLIHKARQFVVEDFERFDYIVAMDYANKTNILSLVEKPEYERKVLMMRQFDAIPDNGQVPDPYFGKQDGFEEVYQILLRSNKELLNFIIKVHSL